MSEWTLAPYDVLELVRGEAQLAAAAGYAGRPSREDCLVGMPAPGSFVFDLVSTYVGNYRARAITRRQCRNVGISYPRAQDCELHYVTNHCR
jgi:hypothetical protein